jgi:hypothetical protein
MNLREASFESNRNDNGNGNGNGNGNKNDNDNAKNEDAGGNISNSGRLLSSSLAGGQPEFS